MNEIRKNLPPLPYVFISSVTGTGISELKDKIWNMLNSD